MDWVTFAWVGFGSTLITLALGDAVWAVVWLILLYAFLNAGLDWYYFYLPFVSGLLFKRFSGLFTGRK